MSTKSLLKWITGASLAGTIIGGLVILKDRGSRVVLYDANREKKLYGRTIIVTGATNGIGRACAEELAARGAKLILPAKYVEKCEKVAKDIRDRSANMQVYCEKCDLADFDSIRRFADKVKKEQRRVDVLVNAAAVYGPKSTRQVGLQNTELHLTVNFLAPYLLTNLLLSRSDVPTNANSEKPTYTFANELKLHTVINLVCDVRRSLKLARHKEEVFTLDFHDFNLERPPFDSAISYAKSKLALALWTQSMADAAQRSQLPLRVLAVDPGVARTQLLRNAGYRKNIVSYALVSLFEKVTLRKPEECVPTLIYAVSDPEACHARFERDRAANSANGHSHLWMSALRNPEEFEPLVNLQPTNLLLQSTTAKQLDMTAATWTRLQAGDSP